MTKNFVFAAATLLVFARFSLAGAPASSEKSEAKTTEVTFLITGLHCPPCTSVVERSLSKVKGVRSAKVDWDSKKAKVAFDESAIAPQQIAKAIADTPHMMGNSLHYAGWLALKVDELRDDASGKPIEAALEKIDGVKTVALYPKQHTAAVLFTGKGGITDGQLIDALTEAGFHAKNL